MEFVNNFKKTIVTLSLVAYLAIGIALFDGNIQQSVNEDDLFESEPGIVQTDTAKQEARREIAYLSEENVKFASALLTQVYMKHLRENNLNQHLMPLIANGTPFLTSINTNFLVNGDEPKNLRRFATHELYQLQNTPNTLSLFKNVSLLRFYLDGSENITLDEAKDALAELCVLFNLNKNDIIKIATSTKNGDALINNSYKKAKKTLDSCFVGIKKIPNIKGKMLIDENSKASQTQQIFEYIEKNMSSLQSSTETQFQQ